ncbi:hypothetical protein AB0I60_01450 [Actinosynnema sp. NPDC050436]|uniref:hypothetical protein n=1 Tax=Actinosynnema sp. NPDC050436 TaxID=3155659 RepID=UPI003401DB7D
MENTQGSGGRRARVWAVGVAAVAITALVPGSGAATQTQAEAVAQEVVLPASVDLACGELEADGRTVFGYDCDTEHWGGLASFTLTGANGQAYRCRQGWAEGSLWVRGDDCRRSR